MKIIRSVTLFGALLISLRGGQAAPGANNSLSSVMSCNQLTLTKPGIGDSYKSAVRNSDYDFKAIVPRNLTAWSGVADEAPFHGFTIFLDATEQSCIVFEVHIRVDEDIVEAEHPPASKRIILGKALGWQKTMTGLSNGVRLVNKITTFSFAQTDQTDDGEITLVAPMSEATKSVVIYDEFIRNLKFGH